MEYLKKVVAASKDSMPEEEKKTEGQSHSIAVTIPSAQAAGADGDPKEANMDDLLAGYEDELGIENDTMQADTSASIAQEVNLLKQASES